MRIAFVGKGGSGKSTIAGTVARLLAEQASRVYRPPLARYAAALNGRCPTAWSPARTLQ